MAIEWDYSGIGYPDTCISIEGFYFSNMVIDAGRKAKKICPALTDPIFWKVPCWILQSRQSHSRGAHDEGELQADLKDWNLLLSKQTGKWCRSQQRQWLPQLKHPPHRPKEMLHLASWQNCSSYETSSWTCDHGSWKRRAKLPAWKWSRLQ